MDKIFGSGYKNNVPVIHYTEAPAKVPNYSPRLKPVCGQRSRSAYNRVAGEATVNCEKCLNAVVGKVSSED
jgi:hypothetical protein